MPLSFTRTLRLKVRTEAYAWLNAAARTDTKRKLLSGFDQCVSTGVHA
jgi:hypothetical protein